MKPLFAYGTLRDAAWREALLGARYPAHPALLPGYVRIANASGYLSLRVTGKPADAAAGMLIDLDDLGWRIADAWEDAAVTPPADAGPARNGTPACANDTSAAANDTSASANGEVVLYDRLDVVVETPSGPVEATAYICPDDSGPAVDDDRIALRSDADVRAAIAAFEPRMRALRAGERV